LGPAGAFGPRFAVRAYFHNREIMITLPVGASSSKATVSASQPPPASGHESPGDLIRTVLGLSACLWLAVHVFILPKDAEASRTWLYLGLAVLPLAILCAFVIW
jgi:hypothetical protein